MELVYILSYGAIKFWHALDTEPGGQGRAAQLACAVFQHNQGLHLFI